MKSESAAAQLSDASYDQDVLNHMPRLIMHAADLN